MTTRRPHGTEQVIAEWYANPPAIPDSGKSTQEVPAVSPIQTTAAARVKAAGTADGLGEGQFTALVSVFGNIDSYGDVVMPGAFAESLKAWAERGDRIPVVWSHDWNDPFSHIGEVIEAKETDEGLVVTAQLDLDNPKAAQVYRLLKGRRVTQFSFAYDVLDAEWGEVDGREVYLLKRLNILEVGPTLIGANRDTSLLDVKALERIAAGVKEGRVLAAKHVESLRAARDAIDSVLAAAEGEDAKAAPAAPQTTGSDPAAGNPEQANELDGPPSVDVANDTPVASGAESSAGDVDEDVPAKSAAALLDLITL